MGEGTRMQKALFAAGCFWGVQYYLDQIPGVVSTMAVYTGGHAKAPTYDEVCTNTTGHAEAVLVNFDTAKVSYRTLLRHFFRMHDPTQLNRQGSDIGDNYRSAIFYFDDGQRLIAEQAKNSAQARHKESVVTEISAASEVYPAEQYHQKYTQRTGIGVCHVPYRPL